MKICGITAEYNPFHKGHAYQIEKARQAGATHILAVLSGNFVQRGVPAMLDKWVQIWWWSCRCRLLPRRLRPLLTAHCL